MGGIRQIDEVVFHYPIETLYLKSDKDASLQLCFWDTLYTLHLKSHGFFFQRFGSQDSVSEMVELSL